ncbi:hypothetical protein AAHE18_05G232900 [Arachis hypogaea]
MPIFFFLFFPFSFFFSFSETLGGALSHLFSVRYLHRKKLICKEGAICWKQIHTKQTASAIRGPAMPAASEASVDTRHAKFIPNIPDIFHKKPAWHEEHN